MSAPAEALSETPPVGVPEAQIRVLAEFGFLLPGDQAEAAVLPDHDDDVRSEPLRRFHLLHVHQEAAVTADGEDTSPGMDQVCGNGTGEGETHRAEAVGDQDRIGLVRMEVAGHPHLVRSDIAEEDVFGAHGLAGVPDRLLGPDRTRRVVVPVAGELLLHFPPYGSLLLEVEVSRPSRPQSFVEHPQGVGQVADDLHLGMIVGVNFGGEEVDVDDLLVSVRVPEPGVVLHHVVAQRDHQVGGIDGTGDEVLRSKANGVEAVVGVPVDAALGHEGAHDTDAGDLAEEAQLLAGPLSDRPVARDDDRPSGVVDPLHGLVDDLVGGNGPAEAPGPERLGESFLFCDVFGELDVTGARLFRARQTYGLPHDFRNVVRVQDGRGPLGDGREQLHDIHDLVGFLVQARGCALAGEDEQRGSIHVGVGHSGDQIGGAGAQGAQADGGIAGEAAVDFGHEGGALLVPRQHELDLLRFREGDHEIGVFFAGNAEHVLDSLVLETLDQEIRSLHGEESLHVLGERVWVRPSGNASQAWTRLDIIFEDHGWEREIGDEPDSRQVW